MKILLLIILLIHGLIHLMGTAKAFDLAEIEQLSQPISRPLGLVWFAAAVLHIATAVALLLWPRGWLLLGAVAILLSQLVIQTSWSDARFGTFANVIILIGVAVAWNAQAPGSFADTYRRDVATRLASVAPAPLLTEADIAPLPPVVQRYVRSSGAVGQPKVVNFRVRFRGSIRSGPDARWMPFTGEQHNFVDDPARLFIMDARMFGVPIQVLHRFIGPTATMQVKAVSLLTVADAHGPHMDESETVTLFNDLCIMAPSALITPSIEREEIDPVRVKAAFTNGRWTVNAILIFNEADELVDFVSDDRSAASSDGRTFTRMRWSTPVSGYRMFGTHRLAAQGEGIWHATEGEYAYLRFEPVDIAYNVGNAAR